MTTSTVSLPYSAPSKSARIIGWTMSGFVIVFLLFDAVIKFIMPPVVVQTTVNELGFQAHHIGIIGLTGLLGVVLYAIPRTAILGAVLLMAQFGGAMTANLRIDAPLFSHILFPVYLGILMWGGLWLRMPTLRSLFPIISKE